VPAEAVYESSDRERAHDPSVQTAERIASTRSWELGSATPRRP
jgi:hypothetical protein